MGRAANTWSNHNARPEAQTGRQRARPAKAVATATIVTTENIVTVSNRPAKAVATATIVTTENIVPVNNNRPAKAVATANIVNTANIKTVSRPARRPATAAVRWRSRGCTLGGGEWSDRAEDEVQGDGSYTSSESERRPPLREHRGRRYNDYPPQGRGRTTERLDMEVEEFRAWREAQNLVEEENEEERRRQRPRPTSRRMGPPRGSGGDRTGPPRESGGDRDARPPKHWTGDGYGRSPPYSRVTLSANEGTRRSREQGPPQEFFNNLHTKNIGRGTGWR